MLSAVTPAEWLILGLLLAVLLALIFLGVRQHMANEDIFETLTAIKADTTATAATTVKIDADVTRLLEQIPAEGGMTPAQVTQLRADLTALKTDTGSLASAAAAIDARVPEPEPPPPPV